jgi:hypothetical protein
MSGRCSIIGKTTTLVLILLTSSFLLAQAQWKDIPVGYNMPKSAMPASTPFPPPQKHSSYSGEGRSSKPSWEIEFHGGGIFNTAQDEGNAGFFAPVTSFLTTTGDSSANVSSFMFGPGAQLTQQVGSALAIPGVTALDSVAHSQIGSRQSGAAFGARISRDLNRWFNLEFSADWNASPLSINDKTLLGVEATRTSFLNFFSGPAFKSSVAVADVKRSQGSQLFWTGVVNVNLKTEGKNIPYLTFGGGARSALGPAPHAAILGYYDFDLGTGFHAEQDLVNLRLIEDRTQWLAVLGIGYKYYATNHWGIRFDVREHFTPDTLITVIDATPTVGTFAPSDQVVYAPPGTSPNIQFSNDPAGGPSSLSGPAIHGLHTFRGEGWVNQVSATGGVFYRF